VDREKTVKHRERERAYAGERNFLLDANVARLQIGLQVLF
jgi:hypothetical protein